MNKYKNVYFPISIILLIVLTISSLMYIANDIKTTNQVILYNLRSLKMQSEQFLKTHPKDICPDDLKKYNIDVSYNIRILDKITDTKFFYKKYDMTSLDIGMSFGSLETNSTQNENYRQLIEYVAKQLQIVDELDFHYNFMIDTLDVHNNIEKIENKSKELMK